MPISRAYGRAMPILLTIREARPGGGLPPERPREPRIPITEGLQTARRRELA